MLVAGGWEFLCPPMADCAGPEEPLLADAAVYDARADSWRSVTGPPFGIRRQEYAAAALDGSAYLLSSCAGGPQCDSPTRLLEYDVAQDRWTDHGEVPGRRSYRHLVALDGTLLAYSGTDEHGEVDDVIFDPASGTWSDLPDDPLPRSYDRFVVPADDQLVLTASSSAALDAGEDTGKLAARFDPSTGAWTRLPDAPGQGYQLMATDDGPLLNGHFIDAPGWLLDARTWEWTALPAQEGETNDLRGVLDAASATYDVPNSVGEMASSNRLHVYDSSTDGYVTVDPLPDRADVYDDSSTALGRDLFVYGGQRWPGAEGADVGDGELVGDAWLWTAPRPSG